MPDVEIVTGSEHPREDLMTDVRLELWIRVVLDALVLAALVIRS